MSCHSPSCLNELIVIPCKVPFLTVTSGAEARGTIAALLAVEASAKASRVL